MSAKSCVFALLAAAFQASATTDVGGEGLLAMPPRGSPARRLPSDVASQGIAPARALVHGMQGFEPVEEPSGPVLHDAPLSATAEHKEGGFAAGGVFGELSSMASSALAATEEAAAEVEAEVASDSGSVWQSLEVAVGQITTTTTGTTTTRTSTVTTTRTTTTPTTTTPTTTSSTHTSTKTSTTATTTSTTGTKTSTTATVTLTSTTVTTTETTTTSSSTSETSTSATGTSSTSTETTTTRTWTGTTTVTTTTTMSSTTATQTTTTASSTSTTSATETTTTGTTTTATVTTTTATTTTVTSTKTSTSTTVTATTTTVTSTTITVTSTSTYTTTTTAFCFEDSVQWAPLDMPGTVGAPEVDEWACQRKCMSTPRCSHFTFWRATKTCHLQDRYATRQEKQHGFTSGPFQCWQYLLPDAYSKSGNKTYLPHQFRCMQPGIMWEPDMDLPKTLMGERDEVVLKCQEQCHQTFGCEHFTVIFPNTCRFAGSGARPVQTALLSMSGPDVARCEDEGDAYEMGHTFMRKFDKADDTEDTPAASVSLLSPLLGAGVIGATITAAAVLFTSRRARRSAARRSKFTALQDLEPETEEME